jgi:hypothetical protein
VHPKGDYALAINKKNNNPYQIFRRMVIFTAMKRLLLPAAFVAALSFSACNKCVTCEYTYRYNGKDSTIKRPEVCGNATEVANEENTAKAVSARAGATEGTTCTYK